MIDGEIYFYDVGYKIIFKATHVDKKYFSYQTLKINGEIAPDVIVKLDSALGEFCVPAIKRKLSVLNIYLKMNE
jgi:hypothetical protein